MPLVEFLRHGETDMPGALLGRTDPALSSAGRATIARQVQGRSWSAIVSSPLERARASAEIAGGQATSIEIEAAWREIDFGDWDGRSLAELAEDPQFERVRRDPEVVSPPNGETMTEAKNRVEAALQRLVERPSTVLVVAHGGSIRLALSLLLDMPLEKLWSVRIGYGTRVLVDMGRDPVHGLWGEIVEITQP